MRDNANSAIMSIIRNTIPNVLADDLVSVQPMSIFKPHQNEETQMITLNSQSVNVDRIRLLETLKKNREAHIKEYNEAMAAYKPAMLAALNQEIENVNSGKTKELRLSLPLPCSHENSYTNVIDMLEYSVDETINLSSDAFKAYVKDEWNWSGSFKGLVSSYVGGSK